MNGLSTREAKDLQKYYGKNALTNGKKDSTIIKIIKMLGEPMFILLFVCSLIYFFLGEYKDGLVMLISVGAVIFIEVYQNLKTDKTLESLKKLTTAKVIVIRDNEKKEILSTDIVPGDLLMVYEGLKIPADGILIKTSGLSVDEATLTGEVLGVFKQTKEDNENYFKKNYCYAGTLVIEGTGIIKVTKIGDNTEYGKIGSSLKEIKEEKTPLQKQVDKLVKISFYIALILFLLVFIITFINLNNISIQNRLIKSLLSSITIIIAMIPEEFPVVLTVFLSLGAWRLAKKKSLVKTLPSVETLGSVSTLCVDKTGTITQNKMEIKDIWSIKNDTYDLIINMHNACHEIVYDPMEKAMQKYSKKYLNNKINNYERIKEYPLNNSLKVMGIVKKHQKKYLLSVKGSVEGIIKLCDPKHININLIIKEAEDMAKKGLRVIAVGKEEFKYKKDLPENFDNFNLEFIGLIGLYDPPKENIKNDIANCYKAGINVIMITGDNGTTASAIAKEIGMRNYETVITGDELETMDDNELYEALKSTNIFSRVIPEHKLRIVKALKKRGEIVAMTGDGVNDAPALKCADIGIAMGDKGSDVSREAADLILLDDNFETITSAIKDGRRIYDNIKKAFGYIIAIHVPIALSSLMGPILGISPENLLILPVQVVLLELIIDPTCSIVLERLPAESDIMERKPRKLTANIINISEFFSRVFEGFLLFIGAFMTFYIYSKNDVLLARTMGILIIMIGNIFLVNVVASKHDLAINSIKQLLKDKVFIIVNSIMFIVLLLLINTNIKNIFHFKTLSISQIMLAILIAFICTFSYELRKIMKK